MNEVESMFSKKKISILSLLILLTLMASLVFPMAAFADDIAPTPPPEVPAVETAAPNGATETVSTDAPATEVPTNPTDAAPMEAAATEVAADPTETAPSTRSQQRPQPTQQRPIRLQPIRRLNQPARWSPKRPLLLKQLQMWWRLLVMPGRCCWIMKAARCP